MFARTKKEEDISVLRVTCHQDMNSLYNPFGKKNTLSFVTFCSSSNFAILSLLSAIVSGAPGLLF